MKALWEYTATEMAQAVAEGEVSATETVRSSLARIASTDQHLEAWVEVAGDRALREAAVADRDRTKRGTRGPLEGVPFAVKDVIDVENLPTRCGFPPFEDRIAARDADVVARLRRGGAIPLGKVSTAQFAMSDPPATKSPWDAERTPGGSSTGSGVSVGARQVPMALGTQTGGSILRPAAYNGVVGFKPSFGCVPTGGLFPTAESLDHVGVIARSVADCRAFLTVVANEGASSKFRSSAEPWQRPRLGVVTEAVELAEEEIRTPVRDAIRRLGDAGATVVEVDLGAAIGTFEKTYRLVMQSEAAATHSHWFEEYRQHYGPQLRDILDVGRLLPAWVYVKAQALRVRLGEGLIAQIEKSGLDAILLPAVPSSAPPRATTGSSAYLSPFSLIGAPAVSVPSGVYGDLPHAIQVVCRPGDDEGVLRVAEWCESILGHCPPPPTTSTFDSEGGQPHNHL